MIEYDFGKWGLLFSCRLKGSVVPKSVIIALPNSLLAILLTNVLPHFFVPNPDDFKNALFLWSGYTSVLGFLLVFRTQIAYSRFWEGSTILQQVRGVWFNATSNLVAFCDDSTNKRAEVEAFQHLLVRMMSMLYCAALQQVAVMNDEHFEVIGYHGLNEESLKFLARAEDRCEVIMQWIQRSIVVNIDNGVLRIAPPIASRVFQELSNGIVDVQNARKITDFPFPYPYAQILTLLLSIHWVLTPIVAAVIIAPNMQILGALFVFANSSCFWSMNYIAAEIEMPFGDDDNDLPVENMQLNFNRSLRTLLDPLVQVPPAFDFQREYHSKLVVVASRLTEVDDEIANCEHEGWPTGDGTPGYFRQGTDLSIRSGFGTPTEKTTTPKGSEADPNDLANDAKISLPEVKLFCTDAKGLGELTTASRDSTTYSVREQELTESSPSPSVGSKHECRWLPCASRMPSPGTDLRGTSDGRPLGLATIALADELLSDTWRKAYTQNVGVQVVNGVLCSDGNIVSPPMTVQKMQLCLSSNSSERGSVIPEASRTASRESDASRDNYGSVPSKQSNVEVLIDRLPSPPVCI